MLKKTFIALIFFGLAFAAYQVYQWQDSSPPVARQTAPLAARPKRSLIQTQPSSQPAATFEYRGAEIQPGEGFMVRVFNADGDARIIFQAGKAHPLGDTEFHLTQPTARVLLPGGQLAYVRADEGQVVVQRDEKSNYNPKRGKLMGHVELFIDRTKPDWRKANPELAEPEDHPEAVVKIWMDDVEFDLDLARLETDGPVKVQSVDGTLEGRGLTLIWNEMDRKIKLLRIAEGDRAIVHMNSLVQLGVARGVFLPAEAQEEDAGGEPAPQKELPAAMDALADAPFDMEDNFSQEIKPAPSLRLTDLEETRDVPDADRVDTYQIVFRDNIVAEQREGLRLVGRLKADMLEMLRDFGSEERSAVEHARVEKEKKMTRRRIPASQSEQDSAPTGPVVRKDSTLELRWSGELVVMPVAADQPAPDEGRRFQVVAEGQPVELHDRETGDATCRRLEYHDETQTVWLIGDPENLVTLQADANRQLAGERVFLDRKNGVARVEGPGRMTDTRVDDDDDKWPECIRNELAKHGRLRPRAGQRTGDEANEQILITWKDGVDIRFAAPPKSDQVDPGQRTASREYLQSAKFRGEVAFDQPGQSLRADEIDIVFAEPPANSAKGLRSVTAESIVAQGNVRMRNDESVIECDRLDVEMTTDDVGRNVPKTGLASGNVVARQGRQEIRAADQMVVSLESVPKTVLPQERERLEAAAEVCGYSPESEEWQAVEERLRSRRQIVVRTLSARGDVAVRDPGEQLDVGAAVLDCVFDDQQQITRALVMGSQHAPAHVGMSDFYIRGPQIHFCVTDQTAEVPGEGILRFFTRQDLSGRRVDEPVPVVITWKDSMVFRGNSNSGLFSGSVRAVSEGTILDCRELSLQFEPVPQEKSELASASSDADPRWIAGRVIDLLKDRDDRSSGASATALSKSMRKRLTHVHAIGDVVIASSEYEKPSRQYGPFSSIMTGIMPDVLQSSRQQEPPPQEDQRLLSFVRISGPRMTVDLKEEYMVVEGAGNLLVLDYRPPTVRSDSESRSSRLGTAMVGSLQSSGPSQTVFTWQNSMSYLNRRNVAVLDNRVVMRHAAGSEMAMPEQVAAAMKLDVRDLAAMKSRRAELTCENLVVEFARNRARDSQGASSLSSATELKSFQASHRVRMQENNRSVEGEIITYDRSTELVRIQGSPQLPAWIADLDTRTGAVPASWRGQELEWNLRTGVVRVTGASVMAPRR